MRFSRWALITGLAASALGSSLLAAAAPAQPPAPTITPSQSQRWIRVVDDKDAGRVKLQVAARSFARKGGEEADGRVIWLASAVHVGDRSYYRALQESLDAKDVVLYEGVKPPGAGRTEHDRGDGSDAELAEATRRRLRFLGVAVRMHLKARGELPGTLADLSAPGPKGETPDERIAAFVAASLNDAWGNPIAYMRMIEGPGDPTSSFDLMSYGADGQPGGVAAAADLKLSDQKVLTDSEIPDQSEGGIQQQLARALGLVFQLDAMDHSKPNWRNSDLSVDQLTERITGEGGDADELFSTLGGESFGAQLASGLLRFIGSNQMFSTLAKAMMVEILGQADDLIGVMPGGIGEIMDILIKDRNQIVVDDLMGVLEHEPEKKQLAVIYGAGHMPDLEQRLGELGFAEKSVVWLTAIEVDLNKTGLPRSQVDSLRTMLRDTIRDQARTLKKAEERRKR